MTLRKIAANVLLAISIAVILWMVYSWADTVCHNVMPDPQYSPVNFIVMVIKGCPR